MNPRTSGWLSIRAAEALVPFTPKLIVAAPLSIKWSHPFAKGRWPQPRSGPPVAVRLSPPAVHKHPMDASLEEADRRAIEAWENEGDPN